MDILIRLLMALEAVVCLMLIGVILIQRSKGRGMGISACCTKTVPAGQVGLGCSYAFNDQIAVDLGYRFVYMGSTRASCDGIRLDLRRNYMHQVLLGLRVMF